MKIDLKTYADFRRVFIEQEQLTEEEFRQGLYNADKTIQRPCPKLKISLGEYITPPPKN